MRLREVIQTTGLQQNRVSINTVAPSSEHPHNKILHCGHVPIVNTLQRPDDVCNGQVLLHDLIRVANC